MKFCFTFLIFWHYVIFSQWTQVGQTLYDSNSYLIGSSVSINSLGNKIVVGEPGFSTTNPWVVHKGRARVYTWNGNDWIQQGQDILPNNWPSGRQFGSSVSINSSGNIIAVGEEYDYLNFGTHNWPKGEVKIYEWKNSSWIQIGQILEGDSIGDMFGRSISLNASGDIVAIGARLNDGNGTNSGHVRIFAWNGTTWTQQGQDIDGESSGDQSGWSVSMNAAGDRVAIGALLNSGNGSNAGHVRIYAWNGTSWVQQGQDIDGELSGDQSGRSVSMNAAGDRVAIGAHLNNGNGSNAGHVRIYFWNGTTWTQQGQDINGEAAGDFSGWSVSMNAAGDRVAIGATRNDGNGTDAGHVRIYAWNGTSWQQESQDIDGIGAGHNSGYSVSLNETGNLVVIGSPKLGNNIRIYQGLPSQFIINKIVCDSFIWIDSVTYTASTYTPTFSIFNSIYNLNLTVNYTNSVTYTQNACNSYTWIDGNTYTSSTNTPTYTLNNSNGCDSIVTLNLTINNSSSSTFNHIACDSYTWIDGNTYTSSTNSPTYTLTNAAGCDSLVTLNLTINNSSSSTFNHIACDSYTWIDGNTYTSSTNTPTYTLTTAAGCDSVVTLDLTITHATGVDYQTHCDGYTWIDGNTYTSSTNTPTYTLTTATGCDSVVTLDLTITHATGVDIQTHCDGYTWIDGNTYTSSTNTPTYTLTNAAGCDSTITLDLNILNSTTSAMTQVNCGAYVLNGIQYDVSGQYQQVTSNSVGCDSTINLNLTVIDLNPDFNANQQAYLNPPFMVQFNNNTPNQSQYDYTWNFGDGNTLQSQNPVVSHEYQYNGLYDVTLYANDQITGCTDSLYQHEFIYCAGGVDNPNGIVEQHAGDVTIYPNPTADYITLEVKHYQGPMEVTLYDINGKILITQTTTKINLENLPSGAYQMVVKYGEKQQGVRVLKN